MPLGDSRVATRDGCSSTGNARSRSGSVRSPMRLLIPSTDGIGLPTKTIRRSTRSVDPGSRTGRGAVRVVRARPGTVGPTSRIAWLCPRAIRIATGDRGRRTRMPRGGSKPPRLATRIVDLQSEGITAWTRPVPSPPGIVRRPTDSAKCPTDGIAERPEDLRRPPAFGRNARDPTCEKSVLERGHFR